MKRSIFIFLAAVTLISASFSVFAGQEEAKSKVIAYYFHGDFRCYSCTLIERYSKEAIESNFMDAISAGKLEFKAVNVEARGNEHYINDYKLYTKSLILSLVRDGKEVRSKNLDKIWEYGSNKQRFIDYVKSGVADFLKES